MASKCEICGKIFKSYCDYGKEYLCPSCRSNYFLLKRLKKQNLPKNNEEGSFPLFFVKKINILFS